MMIGTDIQRIVDVVYKGGIVHTSTVSPFNNPNVYTPIEEMTGIARELFEYDPAKAKQMIADAGYPDGLKDLVLYAENTEQYVDIASALMDMWADIGVECEVRLVDYSTQYAMKQELTYDHVILCYGGNSMPVEHTNQKISVTRLGTSWLPEWLLDKAFKMRTEMDPVKRDALVKEVILDIHEGVPYIPLGSKYEVCTWWLWVKNYYGEIHPGTAYGPLMATIWIDQVTKADMGY